MEEWDKILEAYTTQDLIIIGGVNIAFILIWVLMAYYLRSVLKLIKPENRFMSPGQSWIAVIPLLNIFYNFIIIRRLTDSLNNEFYDRKEAIDENPTLRQGQFMAYSFLASNFPLTHFVGYVVIVLCLVCYVNYIIKLIEYKKMLQVDPPMFNQKVDSTNEYDEN